MFEMEILTVAGVFFIGLIVGILAVLLFNRIRTGSASASKIKAEKDNYQQQVETHFAETSKKFKQMTEQYQDLYQHMASGAAELCRPENQGSNLAGLEKQAVESKANGPEPKKANSPEPKKVNSPEPKKVNSPEPKKANSPEPKKANSPEPKKANSPEPKKVNSPEPKKPNSREVKKSGKPS